MRATTPAFFINLITMSIIIFISVSTRYIQLLAGGMAISYGVSIIVFLVMLAYIEIKESKGLM